MAVRIRLQRRGKKKQPVYRVVIQDSRVARSGNVIDTLGIYNPVKSPAIIEIEEEKVKDWLAKGALPTKPVERLLAQLGIIERVQPVVQKPSTTEKGKTSKAATEDSSEKSKDTKPETAAQEEGAKKSSKKETKEASPSEDTSAEEVATVSQNTEQEEAPKTETKAKKSAKKTESKETPTETEAAVEQPSEESTPDKTQDADDK